MSKQSIVISKEDIEKAGFLNVEEILNNIFYIKNFLSEEETKFARNLIEETPESYWEKLNKDHHESFHNKFYDHNNKTINNSIQQKIHKIKPNLPGVVVHGFNRILRQLPKNHMEAHVDEIDDQLNGAIREYALVIYLNDDYEGGELSYLNLGIKIKPDAGSLMIFKTGPDYLHEVKTVLGNKARYCLPGFMFSSWIDKE